MYGSQGTQVSSDTPWSIHRIRQSYSKRVKGHHNMNTHCPHIDSPLKYNWQQESILEGCVPLALVVPCGGGGVGLSTRGVCLVGRSAYGGSAYQRDVCLLRGFLPMNRMTDRCKKSLATSVTEYSDPLENPGTGPNFTVKTGHPPTV